MELSLQEITNNYRVAFIAAGKPSNDHWYRNAREFSNEIATFYNVPLRVVAGMVAATSVQTRWSWETVDGTQYPNLDNVVKIIDGTFKGKDIETVAKNVIGYKRNALKALNILKSGRVFPHLNGPKVVPFFNNIMRPWSNENITIDIWMHRLGLWEPFMDWRRSTQLSPYASIFQNAVATVADENNMDYPDLQAILWTWIKKHQKTI